jgi:hypothetical protein
MSCNEYEKSRENYAYSDCGVEVEIRQTGRLPIAGLIRGIFASTVPQGHPNAVNLRRFEKICQCVFRDCYDTWETNARKAHALSTDQVLNLKSVSAAIVHWKNSSQGVRAEIWETQLREKWNDRTVVSLLYGYRNRDVKWFTYEHAIGVATASAFLRLLFPETYGIIDRRVAVALQDAGIVSMSLQPNGYIINTDRNVSQYNDVYVRWLQGEARRLNKLGCCFQDHDENGIQRQFPFRACDIEMAIWARQA